MTHPKIAVVGGSGFYSWRPGRVLEMDTPYGMPSGPVVISELGGEAVAFLARHGSRHEIPPHAVNYRANLWALRSLGVEKVLATCACGSLQAHIGPGDLVVADQLVDRTWGRADTYVSGPVVEHVSFADPYCPSLRHLLVAQARQCWPGGLHERGTVVVVQGPRFSTRAESAFYSRCGFEVINMTQYPEAYLARELGLCYAAMALVTDRDVGVADDPSQPPVTMEAALAVQADNVAHTQQLLESLVPSLADAPPCACRSEGAKSLQAWWEGAPNSPTGQETPVPPSPQ